MACRSDVDGCGEGHMGKNKYARSARQQFSRMEMNDLNNTTCSRSTKDATIFLRGRERGEGINVTQSLTKTCSDLRNLTHQSDPTSEACPSLIQILEEDDWPMM